MPLQTHGWQAGQGHSTGLSVAGFSWASPLQGHGQNWPCSSSRDGRRKGLHGSPRREAWRRGLLGVERWNMSVPRSSLPGPGCLDFQRRSPPPSKNQDSKRLVIRTWESEPFLPQTQESWLPASSSLTLGNQGSRPLFPLNPKGRGPKPPAFLPGPRGTGVLPPNPVFQPSGPPPPFFPGPKESRTLQPLTSPSPQGVFLAQDRPGFLGVFPLGHAHFPAEDAISAA